MPDEQTAITPLVDVRNLTIGFDGSDGYREVVHGVSFTVRPGEAVGLVGESGSGKSVTVRTLLGLLDSHEHVDAERFDLFGKSSLANSEKDWQAIRGGKIGFVLQDALTSLDPLKTIGYQVDEALTAHGDKESKASRERHVIDLLGDVGIPQPELRQYQYPHELSGGLRQRALIAGSIANDPALIIADEPTTALDVTVQQQVLDLLKAKKDAGSALILVSHDLAVVASVCDRILVMRNGTLVESGPSDRILHEPQEEYTKLLLAAVPSAQSRGRRLSSVKHEPLPAKTIDLDRNVLHAEHVGKRYAGRHGDTVTAVSDASVDLYRGETLGIVGESGSGKSTLARILAGLTEPDSGTVELDDQPWSPLPERKRRARRRSIQVVSQDPISSFDPRYTVGKIIAEPLKAAKTYDREQIQERVCEVLSLVQLPERFMDSNPRQLSGGQRQRVAIARALATDPTVLIADEAVSALDVSIQAQILDLLADIQAKTQVSIVFISHDLGVIHHISDSVVVMKNGEIVERGNPDDVFLHPRHPYTQRLVAALPSIPTKFDRMPATAANN